MNASIPMKIGTRTQWQSPIWMRIGERMFLLRIGKSMNGPEAEDWETANDGEVAWEDAQLVETTHDGQPEDPQSEWIDWAHGKGCQCDFGVPEYGCPHECARDNTGAGREKICFSTIEEPCLYLTYKLYRTYCKLVKLRCTHTNNVFKNDFGCC